MVAPASAAAVRAGSSRLRVQRVAGASAVTSAFAASPMKLLTPRSRGRSVWAYASSFGGGLVAGDETSLDLEVGAGACCYFGTQASTKVYRNPEARPCGHDTNARVEDGGLLVFAPDPVQPFAGSSYVQRQTFSLTGTAALVLVDWFSSGRSARGERWAFQRMESRNEVRIDGRPVLLDAVRLDASGSPPGGAHRLGRFNCVASVLVVGPALQELGAGMLEDIRSRPVTRRAPQLASASPVAGGVLLRIAGESTESVSREIRGHLSPVAGWIGDDPWARKW